MHAAHVLDNSDAVTQQSLVLVLDDTCRERRYTKTRLHNGIHQSPQTTDTVEGILSKNDIDMLLTMFDTVVTTASSTDCLSILTPKLSAATPPPTLFLVPLSPDTLSPPTSPVIAHNAPSETASRSTRSSISHKKHHQSDSSDTPLSYGPDFLHLLYQSSHGMAHIVPVALSRKGEQWTQENLLKLVDLGIRDILTVPCEPANVGGLYMHLRDRILNPLDETVALQRYQKSRVAPEPRQAIFSSWIENDTIIDLLVQSYAPQPNLLSRPISATELLSPVTPSHLASLADKVNDWDFHAGRMSDEDLIWVSVLILEHILNTGGPDLASYKISRVLFMLTVRSCYQPTNHYHNFHHAIDVLQATFQILLLSHLIPPLPSSHQPTPPPVNPLLPAGYFGPMEILALCIAAVGHDAAHPGVTNAFLTASKSSLALLFNERSVLENLHCLTISKIVEDRWPQLFVDDEGDRIRRMILEMILSTDMALHFEFMARFEALKDSISSNPVDEKQRRLIGCCIMKSADISNLARPLNVSTDWTLVLQKEIAAQEDVVSHLNIDMHLPMSPTTTRGTPPTASEQETALAKSQLGFIDLFAEPLWTIGAAAFFPGMQHGVQQIRENREVWMGKLTPPAPAAAAGPVKPTTGDEGTSSFSTVTSRGMSGVGGGGVGEKSASSEGSVPTTPRSATVSSAPGEVRKIASSGELGEENGGKGSKMRKERSFSSLIFWRKRGGQRQSQQQLQHRRPDMP